MFVTYTPIAPTAAARIAALTMTMWTAHLRRVRLYPPRTRLDRAVYSAFVDYMLACEAIVRMLQRPPSLERDAAVYAVEKDVNISLAYVEYGVAPCPHERDEVRALIRVSLATELRAGGWGLAAA